MRRRAGIALRGPARVGLVLGMMLSVVAATGSADAANVTKPSGPPPALRFRPVFHRMPAASAIRASGDYTLLTPIDEYAGHASLVDQATGQSETLAYGSEGCEPIRLAPPWVAWQCATGSQTTYTLQNITTLQTMPAPTLGIPTEFGSSWWQYDTGSPREHSETAREFYNPTTGAIVQDRSGGSVYADLDDPALFRTACAPFHLTYSGGGPARDVRFYGKTAVSSNEDDVGVVLLQRCGSSKVLKLGWEAFAANSRVIAGITPIPGQTGPQLTQQITGYIPNTEQPFTIVVPPAIQHMDIHLLAINDRTLYAFASSEAAYRINLPTRLR